ncbi:cache domain-containing sensor histidine kinase [Cohnella hashimotonis]|uniref:histidine kinase n=1 Tax=Cohnella hashimotonis TaxID=2826895 RepID=A0ABT6TIL4_9BACL|nr:sensor histidine kinase [Cohnella hashimotonis]MDI4646671.1 sensor histidine kinase [Cohnella hashimotonis]
MASVARRLYKRMIADISIFNKIFYGILIIVVVELAVSGFFSFSYSRGIYEQEAASSAARLVDNINTGFEDNLDQVDRIIQSIYAETDYADSNNTLKKVLATPSFADYSEELNAIKVVGNFFQRLMYLRKDFNSIYLYASPQKSFSYALFGTNKLDYDPTGEDWYRQTVAAGGKTSIFAPHRPYQLNYDKPVISYSRLLKNIDTRNAAPYGVILIDLSMDSLSSLVDKVNLGAETGVLFLDDAGRSIYTTHPAYEQEALRKIDRDKLAGSAEGKLTLTLAGAKYLVSYRTSEITGWKLLTFTPFSVIEKGADRLLVFTLTLGIVALLFTALLTYGFSRLLFKPILKLQRGMGKVKLGQFDFRLPHGANDELGQLVGSFNTMVSTIKSLITEKYEERLARQEAEYRFLQAQINPHFIYNTLQIISSMAVVHKVPPINTAAKSLARMMRYSISERPGPVTVKDELNAVTGYLDIQKLRFGDLLDYETDIDDSMRAAPMMKLVLQPIVENAVCHGIEPTGRRGLIRISGSRSGGRLRIEVRDDGAGMPPERVADLTRKLDAPDAGSDAESADRLHTNVGLRNIHRRIKLIYGESYGISIDSERGAWTKVTVEWPIAAEETSDSV